PFLAEGSRQAGGNTLYGRFETLQVETALLETDHVSESGADIRDSLLAFTLGGVRGIWNWKGFEGGVGADVTVYGVPVVLRPFYSGDGFSFHIFFRLRPPAGGMGGMGNRG